MTGCVYARPGSSQTRIRRQRLVISIPDDDTSDLQLTMKRGGIPSSIKAEQDAFKAGASDSYLGLSREEWDKAGDDLRRMVWLD
jgi:hypothetical protein